MLCYAMYNPCLSFLQQKQYKKFGLDDQQTKCRKLFLKAVLALAVLQFQITLTISKSAFFSFSIFMKTYPNSFPQDMIESSPTGYFTWVCNTYRSFWKFLFYLIIIIIIIKSQRYFGNNYNDALLYVKQILFRQVPSLSGGGLILMKTGKANIMKTQMEQQVAMLRQSL